MRKQKRAHPVKSATCVVVRVYRTLCSGFRFQRPQGRGSSSLPIRTNNLAAFLATCFAFSPQVRSQAFIVAAPSAAAPFARLFATDHIVAAFKDGAALCRMFHTKYLRLCLTRYSVPSNGSRDAVSTSIEK